MKGKRNKQEFMYRTAYGLNEYPPEEVTKCGLFWKFVFMFFIMWPFLFIILGISMGLGYAVGFFVASKPKFPSGRLVYYGRWPKIKGHRIWPITVLAIIITLLSFYEIIFSSAAKTAVAFGASHFNLIIIGLVASGVIAAVFANRYLREVINLSVDYLKAKKNKVCPMIKFVDAENREEK